MFKFVAFSLSLLLSFTLFQKAAPQKSDYEFRSEHDPNGTGKFYFGREIAIVMGHQGASWLERPDRIESERPEEVIKNMGLKPSDNVADIGAGTGYFTFRIAPLVREGKVFAVDIQPEMLQMIESRKRKSKFPNVVSVLGTEKDTRLSENTVDLAFMVDAYHEFSYPKEMMQSIVRSLKPHGRVLLIEYRGEDPEVPIKLVHKMTVAQCKLELESLGLKLKEVREFLPYQHFIMFEKAITETRISANGKRMERE